MITRHSLFPSENIYQLVGTIVVNIVLTDRVIDPLALIAQLILFKIDKKNFQETFSFSKFTVVRINMQAYHYNCECLGLDETMEE